MSQLPTPALAKSNINWLPIFTMFLLTLTVFVSPSIFAQTPPANAGFTGACNSVAGIFGNMQTILNATSIIVVSVAVIFAGYQIAFAHKRIGDIAPILIGGLLIGAATQIATWLLPNATTC